MAATQEGSRAQDSLVLGLDIGAASVGWALLEKENGSPARLRASGVRVFEAGTEGDIAAGKDSSRAAGRREKRGRRRLLARRRHRLTKLAKVLQQADLLPPGELEPAEAAIGYFNALDRSLFDTEQRKANPHLLLYHLRARSLDEELTTHEIGRALYHLAQRRGFLSNRRFKANAPPLADEEQATESKRKAKPKPREKEKDEGKDDGVVKGAIRDLQTQMQDAGARTLGEYLSTRNPEERRVRSRYLGRKMLQDEFHLIWAAQSTYHPQLRTEELRQAVYKAIFFQRPLKSQRKLIGECQLEPGRPRAPMASLAAQRFRLLQKVNDLLIQSQAGEQRRLTDEERKTLVDALETQGDLSFAAIRELLGLPKRGVKFNFETEGEKGLKGNRTSVHLSRAFGERWEKLSAEERGRVVTELRSVQKPETMKKRGMKLWGLDGEAAARVAEVALEDEYCSLSRQALAKVLPRMEKGEQFATVRQDIYKTSDLPAADQVESLPRLEATGIEVRNPAVQRALTEVRKVVNAVVRAHGRPDFVRIELARDLKKNRKDRQQISLNNAANRKAREKAAREIIAAAVGLANPSRRDVEKWLLADECAWQCPYTGKQISCASLFGEHPQFDVEHIIPFPRCLDDSFMNKTLCDAEWNRTRKGNDTPFEAFRGDPEEWERIIRRVKGFTGSGRGPKLARFLQEEVAGFEEFTTQQLNDTRYASRLAVRYLGMLYGAGVEGVDPQGRRRVQASRGGVTAFLRNEWELNSILGGGEKTRDDHRQHLVDAVVVALTEPAAIKRLSDAAELAPEARRRRFAPMPAPWPGFLGEMKKRVLEEVVVSPRVSRKVATALHEETIYSKPHEDEEGKPCVHVRKPLGSLSTKDVFDIVDPAVRDCVLAKLEALGEEDPRKAFKDPAQHPAMRAKDGRMIPIHKVRIRTSVTPFPLAAGAHQRHVKLGSNHHVEILETKDKRGNVRWDGCMVSTYEAMHRLRAHQPVVQRDHGPEKRFLFSLAGREVVELDEDEDGSRRLYVVRDVSVRESGYVRVRFVGINDARKKDDIAKAGAWYEKPIQGLRRAGCCKVVVTPLGEVRRVGRD